MESYEDRKKAWEDLEVTRGELKQLTECMKRPEFRDLLREYAEEVNDPANRRLYEAELTQLERERGYEVTFVHPEPGYVIKTSLDGRVKCFINVAQSELVGKPSSRPAVSPDPATSEQQPASQRAAGLSWSIPYVLAPGRDDLDRNKQRCRVFDVLFHPDAIYLAQRNPGFKSVLNDTAMDGVESNFKVQLDRKNIRFPKMDFKGVSQPTVIRKPCEKPTEKLDIEPEIYQKLMSSYDEARERHSKKHGLKPERRASPTKKYFNSRNSEDSEFSESPEYTKPRFVVKHQSCLDLDEFREAKDAKLRATVPKNLVVDVDLPLLKSANDATLDVQERHLSLKSETPAKYLLDLPLSYRVDPDRGNAKFDAKSKKLTVTLPVVPDAPVTSSSIDPAREDSGVESDHGSPLPESQLDGGDSGEKSNDHELVVVRENSSDSVISESIDTALRTSVTESRDDEDTFADPNVKYSLPTFTCNLYDDVLAVTVHAKNVDSESIRHRILERDAGLRLLMTSVGAGYFPTYYSLCLKLGEGFVVADSLTIEPWDNNVVVLVKIRSPGTLSSYLAGINEELLEAKDLTAAASIKNKLQSLEVDNSCSVKNTAKRDEEDPTDASQSDKNVEVIRSDNEVVVNVKSSAKAGAFTDDDDDDDCYYNDEEVRSGKKKFERRASSRGGSDDRKKRTISESSGDELPSSIGSAGGISNGNAHRYKSILKSRQFSRSLSESSVDDGHAPMSLPSVGFADYPTRELVSEPEGSSLKKTVRFNDVVSRQLYRSNSSILGQRKKNQRKLRNKKRAHERRMSESENSETEEREKYRIEATRKAAAQTCEPSPDAKIRPILHKAAGGAESEEEKGKAGPEVAKIKRKPNKRGGPGASGKAGEKAKTENHYDDEGDVDESFDMKNDLMFDLEV